jgi:hypothetical protein
MTNIPDTDSNPLIYIVILNWNQSTDTIACLNSVSKSHYSNYVVVVVDNGSEDDSVSQISTAFPNLPILQNDKNLGYSAGNNIGIRYALKNGAQYIILLNNDAFVREDTFTHLVAVANSRVGAVGCKIPFFDDPNRLWAAGAGFPPGHYPLDDGRFNSPSEIDYAVGCCMLMSRSALEQVGLLDSKFFIYHDERDWCYRARDSGYKILYAPEAVVYHKVSLTFGSESPVYHYLYTRNYLYLWQKQGIIPTTWRSLRGVFMVWRHEVKYVLRHGNDKLRRGIAVTRGAFDYLRKQFGPPPGNL